MITGSTGGVGQALVEAFDSAYPGGRYANPEEIADFALYLASDRSSRFNGVALKQDGGLEATSS